MTSVRVRKKKHLFELVALPCLSVALAFAIGFVLVWAFGFDPFEVYGVLLSGAFGSVENLGWTLQNTTPLIFTGLSVALAFRAGLFNIGAEGQLVAGAFAAGLVGWLVPELATRPNLTRLPFWKSVWFPFGAFTLSAWALVLMIWVLRVAFTDPVRFRARLSTVARSLVAFGLVSILWLTAPEILAAFIGIAAQFVIPLSLIAAALAGAAWAAIPGILRARLGVSEVINTIMFNFLASYMASYLLTTATFKAPGSVPQTPRIGVQAELASLASFVPASIQHDLAATRLNVGFLLGIVLAVGVGILLWRTTAGFELRAVGGNAEAARAQGIPVGKSIVIAMCLSGALAGLGGAEQVLGVHHAFVKDFWTGLGFTGIAVALVGQNHPLGVVVSAVLFGALQNGAVEIDMMTLFPRELILVLQALIIFFVASGSMMWRTILPRRS